MTAFTSPCTGATQQRSSLKQRRAARMQPVQALFSRKTPAAEPVQKAQPKKKNPFFMPERKAVAKPTKQSKEQAKPERKQSFLSQVTDALDFSEVRSKKDAELLYEAKYGKREDGKMSKEQYQALRRKIGGTAKDYWKDWVDVKGDYVEKGYVSTEATTIPGLPVLIGTVVGLFVVLGVVVSQTSPAP